MSTKLNQAVLKVAQSNPKFAKILSEELLKTAFKTPVSIRFGTVRQDPRGPQAEAWLVADVDGRYVPFDTFTRAEESMQQAKKALFAQLKAFKATHGAGGTVYHSNGRLEMPLRIDGPPAGQGGLSIYKDIQVAAKKAGIKAAR